jgi:hypothetical protein
MRAWWDRGIWRVVRGSGSTGAAASSSRTGAGDRIESTRGFRAGCLAEGAGSETDGLAGFGVKSASAAWRALVVRSRSSSRGGCCRCRWLSKSCPDCLVTRDIEVEFVNFGSSLPQMLGATSTSKSIKAHKRDSGKFTPLLSEALAVVQPALAAPSCRCRPASSLAKLTARPEFPTPRLDAF